MRINISVQFRFTVPLTKKDVEHLITLSARHYDGACQLAGKEDGFLRRWNRLGEMFEVMTGFEELDLCIKIMGMVDTLDDPRDIETVNKLRRAFIGATSLANRKYTDWQAAFICD